LAVPQRPGLRLRTPADVFAEAEAEAKAENVTLCTGGTETQVRQPKAGRPGRGAPSSPASASRWPGRLELSPAGRLDSDPSA